MYVERPRWCVQIFHLSVGIDADTLLETVRTAAGAAGKPASGASTNASDGSGALIAVETLDEPAAIAVVADTVFGIDPDAELMHIAHATTGSGDLVK